MTFLLQHLNLPKCQFMTSCQSKLFKFQAQNLLTFHWDVTSLLWLWSRRNFQSFSDSQRNHFNIKSEISVKVCRTRRTLGTWFIWFTFAFIIYDSQIFCVGKGSQLGLVSMCLYARWNVCSIFLLDDKWWPIWRISRLVLLQLPNTLIEPPNSPS